MIQPMVGFYGCWKMGNLSEASEMTGLGLFVLTTSFHGKTKENHHASWEKLIISMVINGDLPSGNLANSFSELEAMAHRNSGITH